MISPLTTITRWIEGNGLEWFSWSLMPFWPEWHCFQSPCRLNGWLLEVTARNLFSCQQKKNTFILHVTFLPPSIPIPNSGYNWIIQIVLPQVRARKLECIRRGFSKSKTHLSWSDFSIHVSEIVDIFLDNPLFFSLCIGLEQLEMLLSLRGHLAVSGDIFGWSGLLLGSG